MADPTCGQVRRYLSAVAEQRATEEGPAVWNTLVTHRAVEGTPQAPQLTAIGTHLLEELTVRADRVDDVPLETAASDLERVVRELDRAAKTAEYFLAELGPVTPPEIVSYLRPVAVELANRRETADQLAEEFRNFWGSVEVMGGGARDRLLAAELLSAADASLETMFAPFMQLAQKIRSALGDRTHSVAPAAVLQILSGADGSVPYDTFLTLCRSGLNVEEAALLAGTESDPGRILARRTEVIGLLGGGGGAGDRTGPAASVLLALGDDPAWHAPRVALLRTALGSRLPDAATAAAALSSLDFLSPPELANWVDKATGLAQQRQLAPTKPELAALGVGLVLGLRPADLPPLPVPAEATPARRRCAVVLAADAWLYRLLIEPTAPPPAMAR